MYNMKTFLLLTVVLPCIVIADIRCPGGKTCPSSQNCCEVNREYECCDPDVEIPQKEEKIYAGMGMMAMERSSGPSYQNISDGVIQNGLFDCSSWNCDGTCCTKDGCCPYRNAQCCSALRCCPSLNTCCDNGCCPSLGTCCGEGCCSQGYKCCKDGCCPLSTTCCAGRCCLPGHRCCNGWCCKNSQRCGLSSYTCINAAVVFTPAFTSLLMLVATSFVFKSYFF